MIFDLDLSEKHTQTLQTLKRLDSNVVEIIGEAHHVSLYYFYLLLNN